MMSNEMLKQFYWGKLVPWEIRQSTSELVELNGEIDADITYLKEKLSAADREVLERLVSNFSPSNRNRSAKVILMASSTVHS